MFVKTTAIAENSEVVASATLGSRTSSSEGSSDVNINDIDDEQEHIMNPMNQMIDRGMIVVSNF